jgi:hypothetical protein
MGAVMSAYHGAGFVVVADGPDLVKNDFLVYDLDGLLPADVASFNIRDGSIELRSQQLNADLNIPSNPMAASIRKPPYERYFGTIPGKNKPKSDTLRRLGEALRRNASATDDESSTPAAYTYFGQFVFHDITAMDFSFGKKKPSNDRSASLDLDSVFASITSSANTATLMAVGSTTPPQNSRPCDLPRTSEGLANVSDLRSDDNLPLAQTHLAVIRFFNAIVTAFQGISHSDARSLAVSHFQSVVLHDYLPRVIDPEVYQDVITKGRAIIYTQQHKAARAHEKYRYLVPLEFAAACARFGHSMIRNNYPEWNINNSGGLLSFWRKTFNSWIPAFDNVDERQTRLSDDWVTQWGKLLEGQGLQAGQKPLMAAKIDTILAQPLTSIPGIAIPQHTGDLKPRSNNLASLSLVRGGSLDLSSAETVAGDILHKLGARGSPDFPILTTELCQNEPIGVQQLLKTDFLNNTPLWFYTLKEAEILGCGQHLGPLASRIVMETIHAAIEESPVSILTADWVPDPTLNPSNADRYTLSDLIAFAGLFNP